MREGRSPQQIGRKGLSNHRWIVGGKLCLVLNQWGLIVGGACATANVADNTFQWLLEPVFAAQLPFCGNPLPPPRGGAANPQLLRRGGRGGRIIVVDGLVLATLAF